MVLYPVVDKTTWDLLQVRWRLKVFDISYGVRCSETPMLRVVKEL